MSFKTNVKDPSNYVLGEIQYFFLVFNTLKLVVVGFWKMNLLL